MRTIGIVAVVLLVLAFVWPGFVFNGLDRVLGGPTSDVRTTTTTQVATPVAIAKQAPTQVAQQAPPSNPTTVVQAQAPAVVNPTMVPAAVSTTVPSQGGNANPTAVAQQAPSNPPVTAATGNCLPAATYLSYRTDALAKYPGATQQSLQSRITYIINLLDQAFDGSGGSIGEQAQGTLPYRITNVGPAGVGVLWTNTGNSPDTVPGVVDPAKAGDITRNFVPVKDLIDRPVGSPTGGWGVRYVFTSLDMKSGFRVARLCEALPQPLPGV